MGFVKKRPSNIEGQSGKEEARKYPTCFIRPASRRICDRIDGRSLLSKEDKIQRYFPSLYVDDYDSVQSIYRDS